MSNFVPTFKITLTAAELTAVKIALGRSLEAYRDSPPHFDIVSAPADSSIGMQRDIRAGLEAIELGNRRGSDKFEIVMVDLEARS